MKNVTSQRGSHRMTHGGGGWPKSQKAKKCHMLFDWPLTAASAISNCKPTDGLLIVLHHNTLSLFFFSLSFPFSLSLSLTHYFSVSFSHSVSLSLLTCLSHTLFLFFHCFLFFFKWYVTDSRLRFNWILKFIYHLQLFISIRLLQVFNQGWWVVLGCWK